MEDDIDEPLMAHGGLPAPPAGWLLAGVPARSLWNGSHNRVGHRFAHSDGPAAHPNARSEVGAHQCVSGSGGFGATTDEHERVCVRTLAGATLTIHVTFCRGNVDQSDALQGTFTADQTGYYEWNWTPKATCPGNPPGATGFWQGTAEVTATLDGQTGTLRIDFLA